MAVSKLPAHGKAECPQAEPAAFHMMYEPGHCQDEARG